MATIEPRAHARLSASAASRWMACPGSVRLSDGAPRETSSYAAEGTAAHAVAEAAYRLEADAEERIGERITVEGQEIEITQEMAEAANMWRGLLDTIAPPAALAAGRVAVLVEARLDGLAELDPDLGGTADFVAFNFDSAELTVVDFKYGRGVLVDADSAQNRIYGLGALKNRPFRLARTVRLCVFQPRARDAEGRFFREKTLRSVELDAWARCVLLPAAKATRTPSAHLDAGGWCRFCPAAGSCPAKADARLTEARQAFGLVASADPAPLAPPPVDSLSAAQALRVLRFFEALGNYPEQVRGYLQAKAEAGEKIEGHKLVAKRSNRKWSDEAAAVAVLRPELGGKIFEPQALLSPAKMEKVLKAEKKKADIISALVEKPDAGLVLVEESDRRPEVLPEAAKGRVFVEHLDFMQ